MAYKTNPVGNRLGITFGWQHTTYPVSLQHYGDTTLFWLKLYLFLKSYFESKSSRIVAFQIRFRAGNPVVFVSFYRYKKIKPANFHDTKKLRELIPFKKNAEWFQTWTPYRLQRNITFTSRFADRKLLVMYKRNKKALLLSLKKNQKIIKKFMNGGAYRHLNIPRLLVVAQARRSIWPLRPWYNRLVDFPLIRSLIKKTRVLKIWKEGGFENIKNEPAWSRNYRLLKKCLISKPVYDRMMQKKIENSNMDTHALTLQKYSEFPYTANSVDCYQKIKFISRQSRFEYTELVSLLFLKYATRRLLTVAGFDVPFLKLMDAIDSIYSPQYLRTLFYQPDFSRYRNQKYFANTIKILQLTKRYKNPQLFADHIASELERNKRHTSFLFAVKAILKKAFPETPTYTPKHRFFNYTPMTEETALKTLRVHEFYSGIRISVFGKLNAKRRTRSLVLNVGSTFTPSIFSERITYALAHARARTGTFGVKVWILV